MGETIRARHRGKAVGTVQSGWAIGWAAAAIAYISLFHFLPAAIAWRAMFWIGILPAFLVLYIRRHVSESEIFQETRNNNKLQESGKFLAIFSPALIRTTMLASVMAIGAQGGYYAITTWLPSYLRTQRGLSTVNTGVYLFVVIAGSFAGYLVSAHLADWLGRKRTLVLYAACSFFAVLAYAYLPISNATMLLLGFPLGFFASGSFSPMGAFLTELFPTAVRGTGQGFSYNVGRAIGAVFPALVGYLAATMSVGHAIAVFAVAAYVLMIVAVALLPETKGKDLRADARI
jgi:MFS family permease